MPVLIAAATPLSGGFEERLLKAAAEADLLIAEERKTALRLLSAAGKRELPFNLLNEHSALKEIGELAALTAAHSKTLFISDAGTPCIADPDWRFVDACIKRGIEVRALAGASSITAALSVSGMDASRFIFLGFPPKQEAQRAKFYSELSAAPYTAVFLERPYALEKTVKELAARSFYVSVSINLGGEGERNLRGYAKELLDKVKGLKAPFTVVVGKKQIT
jgi:16S rRNA (cytidine1402-2'-O)-methyltransferase